jgi:DNA repair exonuclease SbcCD ATPase subunit
MKHTMKNLALSICVAFGLFACGNVEESAEYKELQSKTDSLEAIVAKNEQELEEYTLLINEIEAGLDSVAKDQLAVAELNKEGYKSQKEKIDAMIAGIDRYMEANKKKMEALEKKLAGNSTKNAALEKIIANLKKDIEKKDTEIAALRSTIQGLEEKVGELTQTVAEKESQLAQKNAELSAREADLMEKQRTIDAKDTELNTAYYVVGTRKELRDAGIIKKEGGALGIGKTVKLSEKLDNSKFKKVNIKTTGEFKIGIAKKKNLITPHPGDSYFFTTSGKEVTLKIQDAAKFWSLSKHCVIEID